MPSLSPPCAKLQTWLRLCGIPYVVGMAGPDEAPKRKLPFVEHEGQRLGDATLLLPHLQSRFEVDPDAGLGAREVAIGRAARRMLKEHFYWIIVYQRWVAEAQFASYLALFSEALPAALPVELRRQIIEGFRAPMLAQLHAQGLGRHSADEIARLGAEDLEALATLLGEQPYFFGAEPTTLDATTYASLTNVLDVAVDSPLRESARAHDNLVAHTARMRERFFPELAGGAV